MQTIYHLALHFWLKSTSALGFTFSLSVTIKEFSSLSYRCPVIFMNLHGVWKSGSSNLTTLCNFLYLLFTTFSLHVHHDTHHFCKCYSTYSDQYILLNRSYTFWTLCITIHSCNISFFFPQTTAVQKAMNEKRFEEAIQLRGR